LEEPGGGGGGGALGVTRRAEEADGPAESVRREEEFLVLEVLEVLEFLEEEVEADARCRAARARSRAEEEPNIGGMVVGFVFVVVVSVWRVSL